MSAKAAVMPGGVGYTVDLDEETEALARKSPAGPLLDVHVDAKGTWVFLPVFTFNIGRGVTQAKAKANITKTFNEGWMSPKWAPKVKVPGIKGYVEIDEADAAREHDILEALVRKGAVTDNAEHRAMLDQARKRNRMRTNFGGFAQATPVGVPEPWSIEDVIVTLTTKGKAKVSPHRVCVQVEIKHPAMDKSVWILNGHYPYKWPEGWNACQEKWSEIAGKHQDASHTMFLTRDINQHERMPKVVRSEVMCTQGIDRVSFVPGEVAVKKVPAPRGRKTINLTIDGHDGEGVGFLLAA